MFGSGSVVSKFHKNLKLCVTYQIIQNYVLYFFSFYVYTAMKYSYFNIIRYYYVQSVIEALCFLAHDRMSVASLCNHDLSVVVVIIVICEHSSWPHAWPNKVHTLHAHAAISCIVAHQKLYHSDLYLLYSSHICMFILMSIVHEVINIATSNLTETCI